ncbi:MAG: efflux RND transporter periplasmic adaptor subunit [Candidatus Xenobia bacterium]
MRRTPLIAGFVLVGLLLLAGIVPKLHQFALLREDSSSDAHPTVVVTHPKLVPDPGISLPASMQAVDESIVSARQTGYLKRYLVDIGSHVHQGQLLGILQAPDTDQQLAQAQAQKAQSDAQLAQSRSDAVKLSAATSGARAQQVQAEAQVAHAHAAEAQAQANVAAAERQLAEAQAQAQKASDAEVLAQRTWARTKQLFTQGYTTALAADQAEAAWKESVSDRVAAQRTVDSARANVQAQQAAWHSAQADVKASRANLQTAVENVNAAVAAEHTGVLAIDAADANDRAARANLQRNQTLQGFERVLAPFDGVITNRYADAGALITADGSNKSYLFGIARTSTLRVQLHVPETYSLALKVGQPATMEVRELPGRTFDARITKVAGGLDPATRTELVEVWTDNRDGRLLPGMYANVTLKPPMVPALHVPGTALIIDSRGTGVLVVETDNTVRYTHVAIGRDFGTEVEILQGLQQGDTVVDTPSDTLKDGEAVTVVAEATSAPTPAESPKVNQHGT